VTSQARLLHEDDRSSNKDNGKIRYSVTCRPTCIRQAVAKMRVSYLQIPVGLMTGRGGVWGGDEVMTKGEEGVKLVRKNL
jgi:hypothetical protein